MGLEGLLAELLVATGLHGVDLESVGVAVHEMVLGEHVRDGHEGGADAQHGHDHNLGVGDLGATEVVNVLGDVVGHLGCGGGGAVIVLDHTVVELGRHGDNHVIVVGVEVATLGHIKTEWWLVVVTSQQVVGVVDETRLHETSLGQLWWPHTHVGVLGGVDGHVGWPDPVVDLTLAEVPLLEVVAAVLLVTRVDLRQVDHLAAEFDLRETLVDQQIVLLMHGAVAALARS